MKKKLIEDNFHKFVSCKNEDIKEAMLYSLNAGGKRLRPILLLTFAEILGVDNEKALPFAMSLEMIHTYSLIHDDLPCMDNDDFRRGKPTNHKVFGQAMAVLAGDALLNLAFETMSNKENLKNFSAEQILKVIFEMSYSSGTQGMISGQVFDINDNSKNIEQLQQIHKLKTGELIRCACVCGAILGGANDDQLKFAHDFAINLGIAFQIRDDILDVYGDSKKLGKNVGSDAKNDKVTYTSLYSLEECENLVNKYTNIAVENAKKFKNCDFLVDLAESLTKRES